MKNIFLFTALTLLLASCNPRSAEKAQTGDAGVVAIADGTVFNVIDSASTVFWRGTKPGGEHTGTVGIGSGSVTISNNTIGAGSFEIDLNSIVCTDLTDPDMNGKLVGHLKSEDFFHVAQFPVAKFDIVSVKALPDSVAASHEITGNLTMRGVTKSITFPAVIDINPEGINASTDEFAIDRTLWNVSFMSKSVFANLKDQFINDDINLKLNLTFSK